MQKLGELLSRAGVKGADKNTKTRAELLNELQQMSRIQNYEPTRNHPKRALDSLPDAFRELEKCEKGREFLLTFAQLAQTNPTLITKQTIHGVSQLLHQLRDQCTGSKRKNFDQAVPKILDLKNRIEKKEEAQAVQSSVINITKLWLTE